jgi:hypothetical protein
MSQVFLRAKPKYLHKAGQRAISLGFQKYVQGGDPTEGMLPHAVQMEVPVHTVNL